MTTQPKCPKNKALFATTAPGSDNVVYRTSARDYTHASWVQFPDKGPVIIGFHASEANALKTLGGQSGAQVRWFKSMPHGAVPVEIVQDRRTPKEN